MIWKLESTVQEREIVVIMIIIYNKRVLTRTACQAERKPAEGEKQLPPRLGQDKKLEEKGIVLCWFGGN